MIMHFRLFIILLFTLYNSGSGITFDFLGDLSCDEGGKEFGNTTLAGYYFNPDDIESTVVDVNNNLLGPLQVYLDGRKDYVSVAVDPKLKLPYGTKICIEFLNRHYGQYINFEVRDTSEYLVGKGLNRIDIFVRSEQDSYDAAINKQTKIILSQD